jgi:uncharacterized membrane protein YbhN (UPF0104 family)
MCRYLIVDHAVPAILHASRHVVSAVVVIGAHASSVRCKIVVRWIIVSVVLGGFVAWAHGAVDAGRVAGIVVSADLFGVFVAMPFLVLSAWVVRAARWMLILRALGIVTPVVQTYLSVGASLGLAAATPAQAGEFLKLVHLKSKDGSTARAAGGFAAERLADVIVLAALTLVTSNALFNGTGYSIRLAVLLVTLASVAGAAVVMAGGNSDRLPLPGVVRSTVAGCAEITRKPAVTLLVFGATLISWLLTARLWQVSLATVAVEISMVLSVALVGVVTFATVLSFLPGGAGVADITVVALLTQQGHTVEQGLAAALILRFISFLIMTLGLVHWIVLKLGGFLK